MPGSMDGLALAHYVRGRWPPIKIIVTSGYVKMRDDDLPLGAIFVAKPYYPKNIAHEINDLLAAQGQCSFEEDGGAGEVNAGEERLGEFVVASGDCPECLSVLKKRSMRLRSR